MHLVSETKALSPGVAPSAQRYLPLNGSPRTPVSGLLLAAGSAGAHPASGHLWLVRAGPSQRVRASGNGACCGREAQSRTKCVTATRLGNGAGSVSNRARSQPRPAPRKGRLHAATSQAWSLARVSARRNFGCSRWLRCGRAPHPARRSWARRGQIAGSVPRRGVGGARIRATGGGPSRP